MVHSPWSIKGVSEETKRRFKEEAHKAGLTLGQWLNSFSPDEVSVVAKIKAMPSEDILPALKGLADSDLESVTADDLNYLLGIVPAQLRTILEPKQWAALLAEWRTSKLEPPS